MTKVRTDLEPKPKHKGVPRSHPADQAAAGKAAAGALRPGYPHRTIRVEEIHEAVSRATDPISILEATPSGPRILEILGSVFPRQDAMLEWLNRPHPDLGGRTPMQVVEMGYAGAVEDMLEATLLGLPS
jgi:hypothetical protein